MLFLVDAKLVLLQPSTHDEGQLKYDMRVMARNVEHFHLMRDQLPLTCSPEQSPLSTPLEGQPERFGNDRGLRDSLWYFDGKQLHCWSDVESLLQCLSVESDSELPKPISVCTDFYPSSIALERGVVLGLDADLIQRRDVQFAFFRSSVRVSLNIARIGSAANLWLDATLLTAGPPTVSCFIRFCSCIESVASVQSPTIFLPCARNTTSHGPR